MAGSQGTPEAGRRGYHPLPPGPVRRGQDGAEWATSTANAPSRPGYDTPPFKALLCPTPCVPPPASPLRRSVNWPQSPISLVPPHWPPCSAQTCQAGCGHRAFALVPFSEGPLPQYLCAWLPPLLPGFSQMSLFNEVFPGPCLPTSGSPLVPSPALFLCHSNTHHQIHYAFY